MILTLAPLFRYPFRSYIVAIVATLVPGTLLHDTSAAVDRVIILILFQINTAVLLVMGLLLLWQEGC